MTDDRIRLSRANPMVRFRVSSAVPQKNRDHILKIGGSYIFHFHHIIGILLDHLYCLSCTQWLRLWLPPYCCKKDFPL